MASRTTPRTLCLVFALALALPLGGCMSTAASRPQMRSLYPGLAELDERAIARMSRRRVRLPEHPSAALVWIEEGPARSRNERDGLMPALTRALEGEPLAWVQAVPTALAPAWGDAGPLDLRGLRSAGAHFQSDLVLLVQTEVSEDVATSNPFDRLLYVAEVLASPFRRVVATASAEICAVDVRTGVLVACAQGAGPNRGRIAFALAQAGTQQALTQDALVGAVSAASERLRTSLQRATLANER